MGSESPAAHAQQTLTQVSPPSQVVNAQKALMHA